MGPRVPVRASSRRRVETARARDAKENAAKASRTPPAGAGAVVRPPPLALAAPNSGGLADLGKAPFRKCALAVRQAVGQQSDSASDATDRRCDSVESGQPQAAEALDESAGVGESARPATGVPTGSTAIRSLAGGNGSLQRQIQSLVECSPEHPSRVSGANATGEGSNVSPLRVIPRPRSLSVPRPGNRLPVRETGSANLTHRPSANGTAPLAPCEGRGPSARSDQAPREDATPRAKELNDLKTTLAAVKKEKETAYDLISFYKDSDKEKTKRIMALEAAQEASSKIIREMHANMSQSADKHAQGHLPSGPKKTVRKRKNHKKAMMALRLDELRKMSRVDAMTNADFIVGQVTLVFDDKLIRMTACRAARGLALPRDGQNRTAVAWVPDVEAVTGGQGTICQKEVPENPLAAARRPLYGGGMIALRGMLSRQGSPHHYVSVTRNWTLEWLTRDSQANLKRLSRDSGRSFSDEDVNEAVEIVGQSGLRGAVHQAIHRVVGELKKVITDRFFKSAFPLVQGKTVLSSVSNQEKLAIVLALGAGKLDRKGNYSTDSCSVHSTNNPFANWRGLTRAELEANLREHLQSETGVFDLEIAYDNWGSQTEDRESTPGRCDRLFLNSHAVCAMQGFVGFPTMRSGSTANGTLSGPSSILSIARADAWMATVLAIGRQEAEEAGTVGEGARKSGTQGRRNHQFRHVFDEIFPLAVQALLAEIRVALEEWTTDPHDTSTDLLTNRGQRLLLNDRSAELHVPFSPDVVDEMRAYIQEYEKASREPDSGGSEPSRDGVFDTGDGHGDDCIMKTEDCLMTHNGGQSQDSMFEENRYQKQVELTENLSPEMKSAWREAVILDTHHRGDPYLVNWRKATTAFAIKDKKSSTSGNEHFLALKPEFFKSNVCYWFGEVQDAYVGHWKPWARGSQNQSNGTDNAASDSGTFYHPMRLDDMSTHLDSKDVDMADEGDSSEAGSEPGTDDGQSE